MMSRPDRIRFVICLKNDGYPASLEIRKVYSVIPDEDAEKRGFLRVVDESQEDYLYPKDYFAAIQLPDAAEKVFASAR